MPEQLPVFKSQESKKVIIMTAQKSIRLISLADQSPAAGFGAAHRRDAGRKNRPVRRSAGNPEFSLTRKTIAKKTSAAGRRADIKPAGRKAAAINSRRAGRTAAAGTSRKVRKGSRSSAFAGARRSLIGIKSRLRTAIVVLSVMLCAIMLLGLKAPAKEGGTKYYKYYTSVTVGYQEDILDIMDRFRDEVHYETADDYMMEVSRINNLEYRTGDLLEVHAGDQLIVPYYSTEFR